MPNRPIRVVLVRPRNPLNIGACARAMANFGWTDLVVVEPYEEAWQETRSAPEAEEVVLHARAVKTWDEAVQGMAIVLGTSSFHHRPLEHVVIELPNVNRYLSPHASSAPLALVFGSERSGLSNEELVRCHAILHIPTTRATPSMNLAQAVAVTLYECRRDGWEPQAPAQAAPAEDQELLIQTVAELGTRVNYPAGFLPSARLGRVRRAFGESVLTASTVRFLLSLVRLLSRKVL